MEGLWLCYRREARRRERMNERKEDLREGTGGLGGWFWLDLLMSFTLVSVMLNLVFGGVTFLQQLHEVSIKWKPPSSLPR